MSLAFKGIKSVLRSRQRLALVKKSVNQTRKVNNISPPVTKKSDNEYCIDLVRRSDYENYLNLLLYPADARRAGFAVRAFNVEIAQVRDTVTDSKIGLMRMHFWKDAVERIYKEVPPHSPVAMELSKAIHQHKLSKRWLNKIIEGRADQLTDTPYRNIKELEEYAEKSVSSVNYLLLQCFGITELKADHAASHLGKAQGIVTMLRATPFNASRRRVYLPTETLLQYSVSHEDILRGKTNKSLADSVYDLASVANHHLETARSIENIHKKAHIVFLNAVACEHYLKKLQQLEFNVFHPTLQHRNHLLPWHLLYRKLKRTF